MLLLLRILPRSRGSLQRVAGAESSFAEAAVVESGPGSDSRPNFGSDSGLDSGLGSLEI